MSTPEQIVAAEVRAELARQQLSGVRAAKALGWTQNYISNRLRGEIAFSVADLVALSELLGVPVSSFVERLGDDVGIRVLDPSPRAKSARRVRIPGFSPALGRAA